MGLGFNDTPEGAQGEGATGASKRNRYPPAIRMVIPMVTTPLPGKKKPFL